MHTFSLAWLGTLLSRPFPVTPTSQCRLEDVRGENATCHFTVTGISKGFHGLPLTLIACLHEEHAQHIIYQLTLWLLHIPPKTVTKSWISTEYSHCQPRFMQTFQMSRQNIVS